MKAIIYSVASTVARGRNWSCASATVSAAKSAHFERYLNLPPPYGEFLEHRRPKFKQVKITYTFSDENFIL